MERIILLLYLKDVEYGGRLLRFLMGKKNPMLHPELVTVKEKVKMRVGSEKESVAVLTDCMEIEEDEKQQIIYLSNEQDAKKKKIFQYQKAEGIYRELLLQLGIAVEQEGVTDTETTKKGVYCVFSTEGTSGTALAVSLSQYLGNQGKCLYLNLSGFPIFFGEELRENPLIQEKGLAELLFFVRQKSFSKEQEELRKPFGSAYMLTPVSNFKDLLDCSFEDWKAFFETVISECGYDSIVVEMGQLFEYTLDLMEQADRIFIIREPGVFGKIHTAVFRQYCKMDQKESLERRAEYIRLPFSKEEWEEEISCQSLRELSQNSQKMDEIRRLLEEGEMGEEVCIIEDHG
ncbi:MAG: hypothetical protein J1F22_01125 [Lachnospiraceae bacterium]|nr:hypothetical protein [Lachnospiraceae bacterium]